MPDAPQIVSAYDSVAGDYDRHLERNQWMRRALWRHFGRLFHAGDRVIDVGCGTGIDAIHLATLGIQVTALDISPGMVEQFRAKLAQSSVRSLVDVHTGDAVGVLRDLIGPFDGIVSSFAALNTVDLGSFAPEAARLLRPGGRLVAHLLSPGHATRNLARRLWRSARSIASANTIEVNIQGRRLSHAILAEDELYRRFFAAHFARQRAYALGLLSGPNLDRFLPERVLDLVARFETTISNECPLTSAGRFYVVELEKRHDGH